MRRRDLLLCGAGCCWLLLLMVARAQVVAGCWPPLLLCEAVSQAPLFTTRKATTNRRATVTTKAPTKLKGVQRQTQSPSMAEDLTRKEAHAAVGSIAAAAQNKHAGSGAGATWCGGSGGRSGGGSGRKQAAVGELTPGTGTPGRRKKRRDFASSIACSARMSQLYAQHSGGAMASLDRRPKQCVRLMAEALQGGVDCARRDIKSFCSLIFVSTTKKQASQHKHQHHQHHQHQHQHQHQQSHHYQQQHQITPAPSPHIQLGSKQLHGSKGGRRRGS